MPISMSYPGVYVKEDNALSMSISSGSTAVPVFIFNPFVEAAGTEKENFKFKPTDGLIRIESWLDYLGKLEEWKGKSNSFEDIEKSIDDLVKEKDQGSESKDKSTVSVDVANNDPNDKNAERLRKVKVFLEAEKSRIAMWSEKYDSLGYYNLRSYFDNGGGPCYLFLYSTIGGEDIMEGEIHFGEIPSNVKVGDYFTGLSDAILSKSDVSLICLCADQLINKKVYSAVSGLLSQSASHSAPIFCLQGGHNKKREGYETGEPKQSAVYYPFLMTSYKYEIKDEFERLEEVIKSKVILNGLLEPDVKINEVKIAAYISDELNLDVEPKDENIILSPVAAIAGAYCRNDSQRGVWKAPANITLNGIIGLCDSYGDEVVITDATNGDLIAEGINPIRYFPGKGFTVWGARTLDTSTGSKWKYIPVRRLFNIAERDIKEAMAKAVFEPNTSLTWETIRSAVDAYLHNLWKQGALFGDTAEQAYFVKIGLGSTMDEQDIKDGKMIIKVGMAPVSPAEFIILEFSQKQI